MLAALRHRDYRLLWVGQVVSFFGDQFHLVAMPWLVLQLTGSAVQLGLVMATAGIVRAAFMLIGGAWADRHSPRTIMLVSDAVRFVVTAFIAAATLGGFIQMWHLYALAVVFGVVSGFFAPAVNSSVPRLLEDGELESGNALMRMAESLASFVGPSAAGVLIAALGQQAIGGEAAASLTGIGIAQGIDSLTFAISAVCLLLMRALPAAEKTGEQHPLRDVAEGLRFAWGHSLMRWLFLLIALANLLIVGPLLVGLPVFAEARLGGAAAFGFVMSAFAAGNLSGMIAAGALPRPGDRVYRLIIVGLFAAFGVSMGGMAVVSHTWQAAALMCVTGAGNGYVAVSLFSQLQRLTPKAMLGRVMGLMFLAMWGLTPLSQAIAGLTIDLSIPATFAGAGVGLVLVAILAATRPELHAISTAAGANEAVPSVATA